MYVINKENKNVTEIEETSFKSCGFKERNDLQEWIANNPSILGEELLIIQKEFDGFNNTNERLDLLAIDKQGNMVIIENKLDDSGRNVVWQSIKYAGYCSCLKKENIKNIYQDYLNKNNIEQSAEKNIVEFLNASDYSEVELNMDLTQRIILVAKEFRNEVTNTVMWSRKYGLDIKCIKISIFKLNDNEIIDVNQIIPVKDIADIMVSYDEKQREEIHSKKRLANCQIVRNEFWHKFLPIFNSKSKIFAGRNSDLEIYDHWMSTGSGISGVSYSFIITKSYVSVELGISKKEKNINKNIFDYLLDNKESIETSFGNSLIWERQDNNCRSKIFFEMPDVNIFNEETWDEIIEFLTENMIKFEKSFSPVIKKWHNKN